MIRFPGINKVNPCVILKLEQVAFDPDSVEARKGLAGHPPTLLAPAPPPRVPRQYSAS